MSLVKRVFKNTLVLICGNIGEKFLTLISSIILARFLGPQKLGIYSFVFAYLGFFNIFVDLGIRSIIDREISKTPEKKDVLVGRGMCLRFFVSLIVIFVANLIISFTDYPQLTKNLIYISSLSFLFAFSSLYLTVFEVNLIMEYPVMIRLFSAGLKVFLFYLIAKTFNSLYLFVSATLFLSVVNVFLLRLFSKKLLSPEWKIDLKVWKYLLKESWPLILTSFFVMVYNRIDQVMLYSMAGEEEVGYYSVAVRLVEAIRIIPNAFMTSLFPLLSRFFIDSEEKFKKSYFFAIKYLTIIGFSFVILFSFAGKEIITFFYGKQYFPSMKVLKILVWAELFIFLHIVNNSLVISINYQKILFFIVGFSASLNVILNLLLIPKWKMVGASLATLISYGFLPFLIAIFKRTREFFDILFKNFCKIIFIGMIIFLLGSNLQKLEMLNSLEILGFTFLLFFACLFLTKNLTIEDLKILKEIFKRKG